MLSDILNRKFAYFLLIHKYYIGIQVQLISEGKLKKNPSWQLSLDF